MFCCILLTRSRRPHMTLEIVLPVVKADISNLQVKLYDPYPSALSVSNNEDSLGSAPSDGA